MFVKGNDAKHPVYLVTPNGEYLLDSEGEPTTFTGEAHTDPDSGYLIDSNGNFLFDSSTLTYMRAPAELKQPVKEHTASAALSAGAASAAASSQVSKSASQPRQAQESNQAQAPEHRQTMATPAGATATDSIPYSAGATQTTAATDPSATPARSWKLVGGAAVLFALLGAGTAAYFTVGSGEKQNEPEFARELNAANEDGGLWVISSSESPNGTTYSYHLDDGGRIRRETHRQDNRVSFEALYDRDENGYPYAHHFGTSDMAGEECTYNWTFDDERRPIARMVDCTYGYGSETEWSYESGETVMRMRNIKDGETTVTTEHYYDSSTGLVSYEEEANYREGTPVYRTWTYEYSVDSEGHPVSLHKSVTGPDGIEEHDYEIHNDEHGNPVAVYEDGKLYIRHTYTYVDEPCESLWWGEMIKSIV